MLGEPRHGLAQKNGGGGGTVNDGYIRGEEHIAFFSHIFGKTGRVGGREVEGCISIMVICYARATAGCDRRR